MTSHSRECWIIRSKEQKDIVKYIVVNSREIGAGVVVSLFLATRFSSRTRAEDYESNQYLNKDRFDDKEWEIVRVIETIILD